LCRDVRCSQFLMLDELRATKRCWCWNQRLWCWTSVNKEYWKSNAASNSAVYSLRGTRAYEELQKVVTEARASQTDGYTTITVVSSDIVLIPDFMKTVQTIQKFKWETHTSSLFLFVKKWNEAKRERQCSIM